MNSPSKVPARTSGNLGCDLLGWLIGLLLAGCALFAASYAAAGRLAHSLYLLPYALPSLVALWAKRRWSVRKTAEVFLYYLALLTIALRLFCEPSYAVDLVNYPTFACAAFAMLTPARGLRYSAFLCLGILVASYVVYAAHPFEIVYRNAELPYSIWVSFVLAGVAFSALAYRLSRESFRRLGELRLAHGQLAVANARKAPTEHSTTHAER